MKIWGGGGQQDEQKSSSEAENSVVEMFFFAHKARQSYITRIALMVKTLVCTITL